MSTFTVTPRAHRGEKPQHLRKRGLVPVALVDREHKTHPMSVSLAALRTAVRGADSHGVIELQVEGVAGTRRAMLKSIQSDPIQRVVLNATFQEVSDDDMVKVDLPVVASGHNAEMDGEGFVLTANTTVLHVRGKVSSLPEAITVDVSHLGEGQHITAGEIKLPEGVELLGSADTTLFTVSRVAGPVAEDSDLAAEPDGTVAVAEGA